MTNTSALMQVLLSAVCTWPTTTVRLVSITTWQCSREEQDAEQDVTMMNVSAPVQKKPHAQQQGTADPQLDLQIQDSVSTSSFRSTCSGLP